MGKFHYIGKEEYLTRLFKLGLVTGLGPQKIRKLLLYFEDLNTIYSASELELLQTNIFDNNMITEFNKLKQTSDENYFKLLKECSEQNIDIISFLDDDYPKELKVLSSPPLVLFLKGNTSLLYEKKKIAIVGTREASKEALTYTTNLSKELVSKGFIIVSGGAIGIDTAAHKGVLDSGSNKTICVLGAGFNYMYPSENVAMFNEIETKGLLMSEHLPNFKGSNISYLQRNRITSGLSKAVFLVAAKSIGGSMTQAKIAHDQRKPIFCPKLALNILPSEGVKDAVEKYGAKPVSDSDDLIQVLKNPIGLFR